MLILNLLISSIIVIAGIIIGTQNGLTFTDVRLLWFSFNNVSLSLVIFESFIAGLVIVLLVSAVYEMKQNFEKRNLRRKIKALETENIKLKEDIHSNKKEEKEDE